MLSFDDREPTDSGSDKYAGTFSEIRPNGESGLLHGEIGCRNRVVDEGVHFLDVLLLEPVQRLKILNLGSNPGGKLRRVEPGNRCYAAASFAKSLPGFFGTCPQRGYQAHAGNNYSSFFQTPDLLLDGCAQFLKAARYRACAPRAACVRSCSRCLIA